MNSNNENTVSLLVAEKWTAAWRTQCPNNCKAFLIPAVDLVEVLNEMGILGDKAAKKAQKKAEKKKRDVRAYMAIGSENGGPTEERVLLGGTKKDKEGVYRDIIDGSIDGKGVTAIKGSNGSGVYDVTAPCPPYCDDLSPLN